MGPQREVKQHKIFRWLPDTKSQVSSAGHHEGAKYNNKETKTISAAVSLDKGS